MSPVVKVQLEWSYSPKDFIEEPIQISDNGYELSISDGVAVAKITPPFYAENPNTKETLTRLIENRLIAVQVRSHRDYTLSKPSRNDLKEDGTKNIYLDPEPITIKLSVKVADLTVQDKNGNIISGKRQKRLEQQKWFSETIDKHRDNDPILDHMLKSYRNAVRDPDNELVHLYEIIDALSERFGNYKNAKVNLNFTKNEWEIIGKNANNPEIKQGRHKGKGAGKIRSASRGELEEARKAARNLIEKYLTYLDH